MLSVAMSGAFFVTPKSMLTERGLNAEPLGQTITGLTQKKGKQAWR